MICGSNKIDDYPSLFSNKVKQKTMRPLFLKFTYFSFLIDFQSPNYCSAKTIGGGSVNQETDQKQRKFRISGSPGNNPGDQNRFLLGLRETIPEAKKHICRVSGKQSRRPKHIFAGSPGNNPGDQKYLLPGLREIIPETKYIDCRVSGKQSRRP